MRENKFNMPLSGWYKSVQWAKRDGDEKVSRRGQALIGPAKMPTIRDVYFL